MQIAIIRFPEHPRLHDTLALPQRLKAEVLDFSWDNLPETLSSADGYILLGDGLAESAALIAVLRAQSSLGKPILGIKAGAVFLVSCGLVPGLWDNRPAIAVASKDLCASYIRLSNDYQYNAFTRYLNPQHLLPVVAVQQQFIIPPGLLIELRSQGQDVFQYQGEPEQIAAISNKAGNVLALLSDPTHTPEGDALLRSMEDHIASGYKERVEPLYYWKR